MSLVVLTNNTEQGKTVIGNINLYEIYFEELRKKCISFCKSATDEDANLIAGYLREQIYRFRKFKDTEWSISEEYVSKLEQLFFEIQPDTIIKYQHLFKWQTNLLSPIPYDEENNSDYEKEKDMIFEARSKAVDEIIEIYDVDVLIDFCGKFEEIRDLSEILADKIFCNSYDFIILKKIKENNYSLYVSILRNLFFNNGLEVLIDLLKAEVSLSDLEKGDILCHTPPSRELWTKIDEIFNKITIDYYWEHVQAFRIDNSELNEYYLLKLLEYKRPFTAAQIVAYSSFENYEILMRILEQLLHLKTHKEADGMSISHLNNNQMLKLFDKIYNSKNIDEFAVARLEVAFLPIFKYDGEMKCLTYYLHENPKEYINVISKCCRPDIPFEEVKSSEEQAQTKMASEILCLFKSVPGCNDHLISADKFHSWVTEAREYAVSLGYSKAFEIYLGKLLSYSPVGSDKIFPHEIVRTFLELNSSPSMINSFITEKMNQRGVYFASGGKTEKEMADNYYNDAQTLRIDYPKTSAILTQIGDSYRSESQYEQQRELLDYSW